MNRNLRENLTILFLILGVCVVGFGGWALMYWNFDNYDYDCLDNYAKQYCEDNNMALNKNIISHLNQFVCESTEPISNFNPRTDTISEKSVIEKFYYLDEEYEDCKVKERKTFKKIKNVERSGR